MAQKFIYLFFFILFLPTLSFSQSLAQTFTTKEGKQFQIELKPDKDKIILGEPSFLVLKFNDLSEKNLHFRVTSSVKNGEIVPACFINIVKDDGKSIFQTQFKGLSTDCPFNSGGAVRKFILPNLADFDAAGNYIVHLYLTVYAASPSVRYSTLIQANLTTKFTILPPDYSRIGEIIDSLGKTLLDENNFTTLPNPATDALKMVDNMKDERVIPYLAQALDIYASLPDISTLRDNPADLKIWA